MPILSWTTNTRTQRLHKELHASICATPKRLNKKTPSTGSLDSQASLHTANVTPHFSTSLFNCLFAFTWCFRSTKPQDPVLPFLSLFRWQLSLFHRLITTSKLTWHFSFLPASLNSYTNDVNTYRTIVYHELISTKHTGACVRRAIPQKRRACIRNVQNQ